MPSCQCAPTLRHKVTLQSSSQVSDGQGGFTESWTNGVSLWCAIEPTKGFERFQAGQLQTPVTHKVTMRYNASITTKNRLKFGDRIFIIQEVINVEERSRFLVLKCLERQ